jgi:hypothetical protein
MKPKLPLGKIDPRILGKLLSQYTSAGKRVLIGAGIGEDAAIIDMGHVYLVAKTDPITHVTGEIGHSHAFRNQCPRHRKDLLSDVQDLQRTGHRLLRRAH